MALTVVLRGEKANGLNNFIMVFIKVFEKVQPKAGLSLSYQQNEFWKLFSKRGWFP